MSQLQELKKAKLAVREGQIRSLDFALIFSFRDPRAFEHQALTDIRTAIAVIKRIFAPIGHILKSGRLTKSVRTNSAFM